MNDVSKIKEHMEADGKHLGTVLGIGNGRVKMASAGMEHDIDLAMVDAIKDGAV